MRNRMLTWMAAAAVLATLTAACASSGAQSGGGNSPTSASSSGSSDGGAYGGRYGYGPGPSSTPSQPGAGFSGTVQQGVTGFTFTPSTFTVKEGAKITVTNAGSIDHTFTVKGIDVVNSPGQSHQVVIDLAPGTYTFVCRFHASLGMKGTITVTD